MPGTVTNTHTRQINVVRAVSRGFGKDQAKCLVFSFFYWYKKSVAIPPYMQRERPTGLFARIWDSFLRFFDWRI